MSSVWVLPEAIIDDIDAIAKELRENAFPHQGRVHYYSGPCREVWNLIAGPYQEKNKIIAIEWAKRHGSMIIDDSPIGIFLTNYAGMGTRRYFKKNPLIEGIEEKDIASLSLWKHASHLFALSAYGQVTTTVCGASREGVYYRIELKNTLAPIYHGLSAMEFLAALSTPRKKEVEAINLIPFNRVLAAYKSKNIEAAHTLIQLGEIRMALHEALEKTKPNVIREALKLASREVLRSPAEAYKYFLESQERFLVDRALQTKETPDGIRFLSTKTPEVRQQRREEKLDQFTYRALLLIETEIALMPSAERPDFIVPAYVKTRLQK